MTPLTGLASSYCCACSKTGSGFPPSYIMVLLVFSDLTWEVCVRFVDICGCERQYQQNLSIKRKRKKKRLFISFFFFFFFWKSWFYMKYIGENRRWRTIMSTYSILRKNWWYQMDNKKPWAAEVNGQNYNGKKIKQWSTQKTHPWSFVTQIFRNG